MPNSQEGSVANNPNAICLALADKIDNILSLFIVGERVSSSKDPYAIRRSAIGIIRIIIENELRVPINVVLEKVINQYDVQIRKHKKAPIAEDFKNLKIYLRELFLEFLLDRFKIYIKSQNIRADVVNAVFANLKSFDLLNILLQIKTLEAVIETDWGQDILSFYKRCHNICADAERKDGVSYLKRPQRLALRLDVEKELFAEYKIVNKNLKKLLKKSSFGESLRLIAGLSVYVNNFFDKVVVNDEDKFLRRNRLKLLANICNLVNNYADFNRIEFK